MKITKTELTNIIKATPKRFKGKKAYDYNCAPVGYTEEEKVLFYAYVILDNESLREVVTDSSGCIISKSEGPF